MKVSFDLSGVQEGKKYILEFCIREDDKREQKSSPKITEKPSNIPLKKKKDEPCLEDFVDNEKNQMPKFEEPKRTKQEFKVESSFSGKINPQ